MDILRKNTTPAFQIVPRRQLALTDVFKITLRNESTNAKQSIICSVAILANENYQLTLTSFPTGNLGAKFSYSLLNNETNEIVSLGKLIIVAENQDVQDYSNKSNNNFYA
jgi:hypothetical protein